MISGFFSGCENELNVVFFDWKYIRRRIKALMHCKVQSLIRRET